MSEPSLEEALRAWEVPSSPIAFAERVLHRAKVTEARGTEAKPVKRRDLRARLGRPKVDPSKPAVALPMPITAPAKPALLPPMPAPVEEAPPDPDPVADPGRPSTIPLDIDAPPTTGELRPWRAAMGAAAAALLAVGLGLGFLAGSTRENRVIYDRTVRDVRAVHATLDQASRTVEDAQRHLRMVRDGLAPNRAGGSGPRVDFELIEALGRLERPFDTAQFTSRSYTALPTRVVHDLFDYVIHVRDVWERIGRLVALTSGDRRAELDREAAAVEPLIGAVLVRRDDGGIVGALAFLELRGGQDGEEIWARASRQSRSIRVEPYDGAELGADARPVIPIDVAQSRSVLGERRGAFARVVELVEELDVLLAETVALQGRLLRALGAVASLEEL